MHFVVTRAMRVPLERNHPSATLVVSGRPGVLTRSCSAFDHVRSSVDHLANLEHERVQP